MEAILDSLDEQWVYEWREPDLMERVARRRAEINELEHRLGNLHESLDALEWLLQMKTAELNRKQAVLAENRLKREVEQRAWGALLSDDVEPEGVAAPGGHAGGTCREPAAAEYRGRPDRYTVEASLIRLEMERLGKQVSYLTQRTERLRMEIEQVQGETAERRTALCSLLYQSPVNDLPS